MALLDSPRKAINHPSVIRRMQPEALYVIAQILEAIDGSREGNADDRTWLRRHGHNYVGMIIDGDEAARLAERLVRRCDECGELLIEGEERFCGRCIGAG